MGESKHRRGHREIIEDLSPELTDTRASLALTTVAGDGDAAPVKTSEQGAVVVPRPEYLHSHLRPEASLEVVEGREAFPGAASSGAQTAGLFCSCMPKAQATTILLLTPTHPTLLTSD